MATPEFFEKDPSERFTISVDWTGQIPAGYTLQSVAVSAKDMADESDATSIVLQSASGTVTGNETKAEVKAGTNGSKYRILFNVTTAPTGTLIEAVEMHVRAK